MLLCIVYAVLFVDTVNMKIKACNALNAMFVDTVDTGVCGFVKRSFVLYQQYKHIVLMVWLQSLQSQLSKTFFRLKIG